MQQFPVIRYIRLTQKIYLLLKLLINIKCYVNIISN